MLKKVLKVSVIVTILLSISGCSQSQQMAMQNHRKLMKHMDKNTHLQDDYPNTKQLVKYASNTRSKYFANILDKFFNEPDSIPTKLVDPKTDKKAKAEADKALKQQKKAIKKQARKYGWNGKMLVSMIKSIKEAVYKSYGEMTGTPSYVKRGIVSQESKRILTQNKVMYSRYLTLELVPNNNQSILDMQKDIIKDIDIFLLKDDGWKKKVKVTEKSFKDSIEMLEDTIALQKQMIKETDPRDKNRIDSLKVDIKRNQNHIKQWKEQLKDAQNKNKDAFHSSLVLYQYNYKGEFSNGGFNTLMLTIKASESSVNFTITSIKYKHQ